MYFAHISACPPGKYCETSGSSNITGDCIAGYYCLGNATQPNPTDGTTGNVCPIGSFCPKASKFPQHCSNGTYMNTTGT